MKNMTRENQIALEAARHTHLLLERNTFDVNYEEDNYDAGRLHTIEDECPNTFARGAEWAVEHPQEWIDYAERHPQDGQNVLVLIDGLTLAIPAVYHEDGNESENRLDDLLITEQEVKGELTLGNSAIRYWLPAPTLPKEYQQTK